MAKIEPFLGIHYNPDIVADISKVVCPPYDVISPKEQEDFYQLHTYNLIRLILGKELAGDNEKTNKYSRARDYVDEWLRRSVLVQDKEPAIYFYEQVFKVDGSKKKRWGFMSLLRIDDEGKDRTVHPHEHTHTAPKEDRLKLIKSVEANLSPIFTIYSDPKDQARRIFEKALEGEKPLFDIIDPAGIENRLYRLTDSKLIADIREFFSEKELFIADGHHRYEVARQFRDYKRSTDGVNFKDSYNYILSFFTPLEDKGLCILPTHRLIKDVSFDVKALSACFTLKESDSLKSLSEEMRSKADDIGVFGLYYQKKFYLIKLEEKRECNRFIKEGPKEYRDLDVVILHKVIFDNFIKIQLPQINYEVNLESAVSKVDSGEYSALFMLNPTKVEQIRSIALTGEVMPQKSTYFYPKLLSGLLINKF
ncbi:MAG TPA: DUF1015 domain-containing protein [Candidatus Omnitrophota bacterium]|nr:DUF1015 domain-containing protein [Candidatus Omnitrophota bacterium]